MHQRDNTPLISILMPVFNAEETLVQTLKSILLQSFKDWELILVDDGSTDTSVKIAEDLFKSDSRLKLLQPGKVGLVAALQIGHAACNGEFIARMDADDEMHPSRLALQYERLSKEPKLDLVSSRITSFSEDASGLGKGFQLYDEWLNGLMSHDDIVRDIFIESPFSHPSVMIRKSSLDSIGGYQDHGWPEDYDLWLRAFRAEWHFAKINQELLRWRDTPHRTSRIDSRYGQDQFTACKAHYLFPSFHKDKECLIWGAGKLGKRFAYHLAQRGITIRAFVDVDPKKIGRNIGAIPTLSYQELQPSSETLVLGAVGNRGARSQIRKFLIKRGFVEGQNFIMVA
ncbi:glycosyltransferase [Myxococcota bacterium]|nr:glycosyltransferase [Myxococcota bacterium]